MVAGHTVNLWTKRQRTSCIWYVHDYMVVVFINKIYKINMSKFTVQSTCYMKLNLSRALRKHAHAIYSNISRL